MKRFLMTAALLAAICLLLASCAGSALPHSAADGSVSFDGFSMEAMSCAPYGTAPDSSFKLTAPEGYSVAEVKKMLSAEPAFGYSVEEKDGSFIITPNEQLAAGTDYVFTLSPVDTGAEPVSFSFTTMQAFAYTGSYPSDGAKNIPVGFALELSFTAPANGLEDRLSFSPELTGTYRYIGNKAVFMPDVGEVQPYTTYTVTLSAGASGLYGGELAEDVSFSFTTGEYFCEEAAFSLTESVSESPFYETFLPDECPMINVTSSFCSSGKGCGDMPSDAEFSVTVHSLRSSDEYLYYIHMLREMQALRYSYKLSVDTAGLEEVASFTQTLDYSSDFALTNNYEYICFPEALPEGWYVATVTAAGTDGGPDIVMQKLIQVSPITYYQQTYNGEGLLWLNNGMTGAAVANTEFDLYRDPAGEANATVSTDENGLSLFSFPPPDADEPRVTYDGDKTPVSEQATQKDYAFYYTVNDGEGVLAGVAYSEVAKEKTFLQKYYTYLYTDRPLYRQNDTVEFWGVVKPRSSEYAMPGRVRVMLGEISDPVMEQTLDVDSSGTFRGSFRLDGTASGFYYISFCDAADNNGLTWGDVHEEYINVCQYKKPDYTYEASADREYYSYSDTVNAALTVSFFDGTPAAGMDMQYSCYISDPWYTLGEQTPAATGRDGKVSVSVSIPDTIKKYAVSGLGWRPSSMEFAFTNDQAEDSFFYMTASAPFFPSDTMVTGSVDVKGIKAALTVNINSIDLSGLENFEDWADDDFANIRGEPVSRGLHVEIIRGYTVKTQTGTYYDPYTKSTLPSYTYEYQEETYAEFEEKTSPAGSVRLTDLPVSTDTDFYTAVVTVTDGLGSTLTEYFVLGERPIPRYGFGKGYSPVYSGKSYSFSISTSVQMDEYSYMPWSTKYFNAGDSIYVALSENGGPAKIPEGGRWITDILQNSVTAVSCSTAPGITIKADESVFPNFMLCGAYFDGRRVYVIQPGTLQLNSSDMKLAVSVDTDADSYLPGSRVSASVTVLDRDGAPVRDASVCVGVVNEAVFALSDQFLQFASRMYAECFSPYPQFSSSYNQRGVYGIETGGGKGGGDGGAMSLRTDFRDTAGVFTGKTDAGGTVKLEFDLPDDLTSWRISALAMSPDQLAGDTKDKIVTTLPFFVRPIMNSCALSGDDSSITLRGFGSGVSQDDPIDFTVSVDGGEPASYSGSVGGYTAAALGRLPAGEHTVTITGRCSGHSDSVEKVLTVMDSAMDIGMTRWFDLSDEEIAVDTDKSPVTVTLTNSDWDPFLKAASVLEYAWTDRNDEKLARELSGDVLTEFYGGTAFLYGDYLAGPSFDDMGAPEGKSDNYDFRRDLLYLLPYGSGDAIFTGRAAAAAPELAQSSIISYSSVNVLHMDHTGEISLSSDERAALIMAMAAAYSGRWTEDMETNCGEVFITPDDVRAMLNSADISTRAKCYLITALTYVDRSGASVLYSKEIAPLLVSEGSGKYIPAEGEDRAVTVTAAALMAAIKTGVTGDTAAMMEYIAEKQGSIYTRGDCALEAAMYMNSFKPDRSAAPVVTYKLDGKTVTADLDRAHAVKIVMTKAEFDSARFTLESGTATAQVDYSGSPADAGFEPSDTVSMSREFRSESGGLGGTTAIVYHIKFGAGAEYGYYRLTDWVPSSLRAKMENSGNPDTYAEYDGNVYWSEFDMENQLFSGYFWYDENTGREFTIVLRCQNVTEGRSATDSAFLMNTETMEGTLLPGGGTFSWK